MPSGEYCPPSRSTTSGTGIPHVFQYGKEGKDFTVLVNPNGTASAGLVKLISEASAAAIAKKGCFTIALSGGSATELMAPLASATDIDFSRWVVFWADERCVAQTDPASNYKCAQEAFLSKVNIPAHQVYAVDHLPPAQAASTYEAKIAGLSSQILPVVNGMPQLDLIVLGVGPDGHVASLFPNKKEMKDVTSIILPVEDSPKPPSWRVTMSLNMINSAAQVCIVACGKGKAEVMQRVLEVQSLPGAIPAQMVRPVGSLTYFLDEDSASELNVAEWDNWKMWPRSEVPKPEKK